MNSNKQILILLFCSVLWICKPVSYQTIVGHQNQFVQQEVLLLRAGGSGEDSSDRRISIGKKILLQNLFPDWPERIAYQKEQKKFYKSAQAKLREVKNLRILDKFAMKLMTVQEKDALDYFNGTGFYEKHQNPKTLPNIFDTRQSFLLKMEYREVREKFLNSFKKDG